MVQTVIEVTHMHKTNTSHNGTAGKKNDRVMSSIMDSCGGGMNRDRMPHSAGTAITESEHKEEHSSGHVVCLQSSSLCG